MTEHESPADMAAWDLDIERFAGGDMESDEENGVLARCEIEPDRWRGLALACVEHRRLAALLRKPAAVREASTRDPRGPRRTSAARLLAAAAALALVACGTAIGYRVGLERGRPANVLELAAARPLDTDPAVAAHLAALANPLLPDAARQVLREAGIEVREEPVVFLVDGRDGAQWAVPEKHLHVRLVRDGRSQP